MKTLEEFNKEMEEYHKWEDTTMLGRITKLWWKTYRGINNVWYFRKDIKHFYQRGKNGFADSDLWSFDDFLDEMLPKALRKLAKVGNGCPEELFDNKAVGNECHKWNEILEKISIGFDAHRKISNCEYDIDNMKEYKELKYKFDKGMALFIRYYDSMWW